MYITNLINGDFQVAINTYKASRARGWMGWEEGGQVVGWVGGLYDNPDGPDQIGQNYFVISTPLFQLYFLLYSNIISAANCIKINHITIKFNHALIRRNNKFYLMHSLVVILIVVALCLVLERFFLLPNSIAQMFADNDSKDEEMKISNSD